MKSLKVTGRNKTLILPAEWIAGVDHNLQNEDPEENDGDHNDWVEEVDGDKNEGDDKLPEEENEPVTDKELRQLREDEAQRAMDETRNEQENANQIDGTKRTVQSSQRRINTIQLRRNRTKRNL